MAHDEPDEYLGDESPEFKELNDLIDNWLADERPERYDSGDKEWMETVVKRTADSLEEQPDYTQVFLDAARRRVYQREGTATRRANKFLRDIARTGQMPLGWGEGDAWKAVLRDILSAPLSIERSRVRLAAAAPADLEAWELENAREEDKRRLAQIEARSGARLLGDWLRQQGVQRVDDFRPPMAQGGDK
ncbi:hypothetical protein ACBJ59_36255 [Nonomuraea sp. MTCD27]|uniref:hypothetical protein n=1 Tax=Nonomuraea sp. MTCD27 TaxID=1676747 RepID=UPI0035BF3B71